jgi:tRNA-splicing ligase RtcB (3'-phosphate/5'-hydroxy nucleic acid ligase)
MIPLVLGTYMAAHLAILVQGLWLLPANLLDLVGLATVPLAPRPLLSPDTTYALQFLSVFGGLLASLYATHRIVRRLAGRHHRSFTFSFRPSCSVSPPSPTSSSSSCRRLAKEFSKECTMKRIIDTEETADQALADRHRPDTLQQAKNLANLPCLFHHVAIMPDAHVGYGMPIGGVAAAIDSIIPNAVGVDIGCGVAACKTSLSSLSLGDLKTLLGTLRRAIPLGFAHHKTPQPEEMMPPWRKGASPPALPIVAREYENGRRQLGTLGGGNHFIEVQRDDSGFLWLMIHSGSRNLGYQVANHYNRLAAEFTRKHASDIPAAWQLDSLPLDSPQGRSYLEEMTYCVRFAAANRLAMMERVKELLVEIEPSAEFSEFHDVAHNYAAEDCTSVVRWWCIARGPPGRRAARSGSSPARRAATATWCAALATRRAFLHARTGRVESWAGNRRSGSSISGRKSPDSRLGAFSMPSATRRISRRPPAPIKISTRSSTARGIWCRSSPPCTPWRWSKAELRGDRKERRFIPQGHKFRSSRQAAQLSFMGRGG